MSFPTIVQFRGIDASDALHAKIEEYAQRLSKFADDIRSCHVVVSVDRASQQQGEHYRISIHLTLDGHEILAGDAHAMDPRHQDPYVAVADAFHVARRCIEDYARRRRAAARPARRAANPG